MWCWLRHSRTAACDSGSQLTRLGRGFDRPILGHPCTPVPRGDPYERAGHHQWRGCGVGYQAVDSGAVALAANRLGLSWVWTAYPSATSFSSALLTAPDDRFSALPIALGLNCSPVCSAR
jgi:hypothetical protein